jgi:hypothetical protein
MRSLVRRQAWWVEVAVVVAFYLAYASTRALAPGTRDDALANAGHVVGFERSANVDPELWLNHAVAPIGWLGALAGYYYLTLHFAVTVGALVWLYLRRPHLYAQARTSLVLASYSALIAFWFLPVAPPRLAEHGIVDVVVQHNTFGAANAQQGGSSLENVYAAMPSLHVGWALWVAMVVHRSFATRWRELAWLYPLATTFVVLSTGNHYLVDAVAGAAIVLAADALTGSTALAARTTQVSPADSGSTSAVSRASTTARITWGTGSRVARSAPPSAVPASDMATSADRRPRVPSDWGESRPASAICSTRVTAPPNAAA